MSLAGIIHHYKDFLRAKARAGCRFRFILLDPDSDATKSAIGFFEDNPQYRKQEIQISSRTLGPIPVNEIHSAIS